MAAVVARARAADGAPAAVGRAVLRTYAAVLFSRSYAVGTLLLLATLLVPRAAAGGVLGVLAALAAALWFDLDREAMRDGSYSVSALLIGLGVAQTIGLFPKALALLVTLAGLSALVTAALRAYLHSSNLPTLSVPFLILFYLLFGVLPALGLSYTPPHPDSSTLLPQAVATVLRSIGALLFLPRWDSGLLLLVALLLHSRIAALLAVLAVAFLALLQRLLPPLALAEHLTVLTFNAVFSAIALGGVWFVPSPSSLLLALLGVLLCALFTVGGAGPLMQLGLPVLIVPFNATVLLVLLASRQRAWDRRPKSVDFVAGTPEQNLAYFRTRLLRFRWLYPTRFRLPVRGTWVCTQGVDGALSHKGRWRHAFDFEVAGPDGRLHAGEQPQLKDYYCYRLPVLAAAAGVVAKVESAVPDNEVGGMNLEQNWGNYVILYHAPGLYSMVAHLQRGSIKVVEGQSVRQGELLGLCGNSGRSPRPHVHFQLQTGNRAGDPTLPCRFTDAVVVTADAETVVADLAPEEDQQVRNLEYDEERASFFAFPYRAAWRYRIGKSSEQIEVDLDALGQLLLRTSDRSAQLAYSLGEGFFTTYDAAGATSPALHVLRAALSRVPLDAGAALRWRDYLPARQFRSQLGRVLSDVVSPFLHRDGIEMEYTMKPEGPSLVVTGASRARDASGQPMLATRIELSRGNGPLRASLTLHGRTQSLERQLDTQAAGRPIDVAIDVAIDAAIDAAAGGSAAKPESATKEPS
jgi:murein DD-endopeptidase MepM/ murein hydrolase activator NlpD/urea transporter